MCDFLIEYIISLEASGISTNLLKELNHPNIVKYLDNSRSKHHLNIILEYIESGSLLNVMKKYGNITEKLAKIYTKQTLKGLIYLHSQGVVHRDIKARD